MWREGGNNGVSATTHQKACFAENKSESPRWRETDSTYRNVGVWRLARRAQSLHNRGVWQYAEHVTAGPLYLISANMRLPDRPARRGVLHVAHTSRSYYSLLRNRWSRLSTGYPRHSGRFPPTWPAVSAADIFELPAFCSGEDKIITKIT